MRRSDTRYGSLIRADTDHNRVLIGLGHALAHAGRPLIYGGGRKGIMGVVSGAVIDAGGRVTGVIPYAMVAAGGEKEQADSEIQAMIKSGALFDGQNRQNVSGGFVCSNLDGWTTDTTAVAQEDTVRRQSTVNWEHD